MQEAWPGPDAAAPGRLPVGEAAEPLWDELYDAPWDEDWGALRAAWDEPDDDRRLDLLRALAKRRPDFALGRRALGSELAAAGWWQEAVDVLTPEVASAPWDENLRLDLGRSLAALGHWPLAREQLAVAVDQSPGSAPALAELGWVLQNLGCWEESQALCRAAVAADPRSALGHLCLGETLAGQDAAKAEAHARAALAVWPDSAWGHTLLSQALLDRGRYAQGHRAAARAVEAAPGLGRPRTLLCFALGELQRWPEAVKAGHAAVGGDLSAGTLNTLGWAQFGRGHLHGAEQSLRRAIAMDPAHDVARRNLATLLAHVGRLREARGHFEALLTADPDDAMTLAGLGWIDLICGRRGPARTALGRAAALLAPTSTAARPLLLLGAMARQDGRPAAAREYFLAALSVSNRRPVTDIYSHPCGRGEDRALAHTALGNPGWGRRSLERALLLRDGADRFDPRLYAQFADPALPGLEDLTRLWASR